MRHLPFLRAFSAGCVRGGGKQSLNHARNAPPSGILRRRGAADAHDSALKRHMARGGGRRAAEPPVAFLPRQAIMRCARGRGAGRNNMPVAPDAAGGGRNFMRRFAQAVDQLLEHDGSFSLWLLQNREQSGGQEFDLIGCEAKGRRRGFLCLPPCFEAYH